MSFKFAGKRTGGWSGGGGHQQHRAGGFGKGHGGGGKNKKAKQARYQPPVENGIECPLCSFVVEAESLSDICWKNHDKHSSEQKWLYNRWGMMDDQDEDDDYGKSWGVWSSRDDYYYGAFHKHMLSHIELHMGTNTWGYGGKPFMGYSTDEDCDVDAVKEQLGTSACRVGRLMSFAAGVALELGLDPPGGRGWPLVWGEAGTQEEELAELARSTVKQWKAHPVEQRTGELWTVAYPMQVIEHTAFDELLQELREDKYENEGDTDSLTLVSPARIFHDWLHGLTCGAWPAYVATEMDRELEKVEKAWKKKHCHGYRDNVYDSDDSGQEDGEAKKEAIVAEHRDDGAVAKSNVSYNLFNAGLAGDYPAPVSGPGPLLKPVSKPAAPVRVPVPAPVPVPVGKFAGLTDAQVAAALGGRLVSSSASTPQHAAAGGLRLGGTALTPLPALFPLGGLGSDAAPTVRGK